MNYLGLAIALSVVFSPSVTLAEEPTAATTIRTELYPRPPYSGATYYIYERAGAVICTKIEVCNKFDECSTSYYKGGYKEPEDSDGEPFETSPPVLIGPAKMRKHVCLVRHKLAGP